MKKHNDALKTIGEVSASIEVPVYVIRFWETKFKDLKPIKKKTGSRYYSKTQIDLLKKRSRISLINIQTDNIFEKKNIFPSIPKKKSIFILPILIDTTNTTVNLFNQNPFFF